MNIAKRIWRWLRPLPPSPHCRLRKAICEARPVQGTPKYIMASPAFFYAIIEQWCEQERFFTYPGQKQILVDGFPFKLDAAVTHEEFRFVY